MSDKLKIQQELTHHGKMLSATDEILMERERQYAKWGEQNHTVGVWMLILQEELGEFAKAHLEGDYQNAAIELIQVAAVAHAMVQNMLHPPNTETTSGNTKAED